MWHRTCTGQQTRSDQGLPISGVTFWNAVFGHHAGPFAAFKRDKIPRERRGRSPDKIPRERRGRSPALHLEGCFWWVACVNKRPGQAGWQQGEGLIASSPLG